MNLKLGSSIKIWLQPFVLDMSTMMLFRFQYAFPRVIDVSSISASVKNWSWQERLQCISYFWAFKRHGLHQEDASNQILGRAHRYIIGSGEHFSFLFLPATFLSLSRIPEGLFEKTWRPSRARLTLPRILLPE